MIERDSRSAWRVGTVLARTDSGCEIEMTRAGACASCGLSSVCSPGRSHVVHVAGLAASEGSTVHVGISARRAWLGIVLAFIVPLVIVVTAIASLVGAGMGEAIAGVTAVSGIAAWYLALRLARRHLEPMFRLMAQEEIS